MIILVHCHKQNIDQSGYELALVKFPDNGRYILERRDALRALLKQFPDLVSLWFSENEDNVKFYGRDLMKRLTQEEKTSGLCVRLSEKRASEVVGDATATRTGGVSLIILEWGFHFDAVDRHLPYSIETTVLDYAVLTRE